MLNENFVIFGILLSIIGNFSYFLDTIKGKIQPNRTSFFLWSLPPLITFFVEIKQGVGIQSLLPLTIGLLPIFIFVATFVNKNAYWRISKFDVLCGLLSLLALLVYFLTHGGIWALFFSILADGLAYLPTLAKAYKYPETELGWPWLTDSLSGIITLFTVKNFTFSTSAFPIYYFIINLLVFIFVQFKLSKTK